VGKKLIYSFKQNYAAKAVFGALRVVGQTLAIAYEQIKLDNQIQAVKNMASYAGAMFGVGGQQGAQQPFPTPQPVPANYVEDTETLPGMPSGKRIKVAETELEAEVVPDQGTDVKDALRAFEAIESAKKGELSAVQSKVLFRTTCCPLHFAGQFNKGIYGVIL
jgi:hypothetical protein